MNLSHFTAINRLPTLMHLSHSSPFGRIWRGFAGGVSGAMLFLGAQSAAWSQAFTPPPPPPRIAIPPVVSIPRPFVPPSIPRTPISAPVPSFSQMQNLQSIQRQQQMMNQTFRQQQNDLTQRTQIRESVRQQNEMMQHIRNSEQVRQQEAAARATAAAAQRSVSQQPSSASLYRPDQSAGRPPQASRRAAQVKSSATGLRDLHRDMAGNIISGRDPVTGKRIMIPRGDRDEKK